ncbi:MAG TPA: hypothetical protein VFZ59_14020 [Verrucomicrobiae bacterium]|nr:hypothetical protein [Verrucomicrobiae bacterium]
MSNLEAMVSIFHVCVSAIFGDLVSMTWSGLVPEDRRSMIMALVQSERFTFIPEEELAAPYDGVMPVKFETWWVRYFDWL